MTTCWKLSLAVLLLVTTGCPYWPASVLNPERDWHLRSMFGFNPETEYPDGSPLPR